MSQFLVSRCSPLALPDFTLMGAEISGGGATGSSPLPAKTSAGGDDRLRSSNRVSVQHLKLLSLAAKSRLSCTGSDDRLIASTGTSEITAARPFNMQLYGIAL